MIIENVDDVSLADYDRNSDHVEQDNLVKSKIKKIMNSVIGGKKMEIQKQNRKSKKEDNKKCYS